MKRKWCKGSNKILGEVNIGQMDHGILIICQECNYRFYPNHWKYANRNKGYYKLRIPWHYDKQK